MMKRTITAMTFGLAAAMMITCVTPAAVFASAPANEWIGWQYVDDDDFQDDEEVLDDLYEDDEDLDDDEEVLDDLYEDDEDLDDVYENDEYPDDLYDDDVTYVPVNAQNEVSGRDIVQNDQAGYAYANCRKNPGLGSDILVRIPNGTRVYPTGRVVNRDGFDWYEISLTSFENGWIAGHLIGR